MVGSPRVRKLWTHPAVPSHIIISVMNLSRVAVVSAVVALALCAHALASSCDTAKTVDDCSLVTDDECSWYAYPLSALSAVVLMWSTSSPRSPCLTTPDAARGKRTACRVAASVLCTVCWGSIRVVQQRRRLRLCVGAVGSIPTHAGSPLVHRIRSRVSCRAAPPSRCPLPAAASYMYFMCLCAHHHADSCSRGLI